MKQKNIFCINDNQEITANVKKNPKLQNQQ